MERERAEQKERDALMEEDRLRDEARQRKLEAQKVILLLSTYQSMMF